MSPEQIRCSRTVDHRSDIWSLGIVLYRLLQGAPPFDGDTLRGVAFRIAHEPLPRLSVPVPSGLDEAVHRCLEKDPARRFQDVAELAHALAPHAQSPIQAAISMQRTRRTLGSVTTSWSRGGAPGIADPGGGPASRSPVRRPTLPPAGGVHWWIAAAILVAACAIGAIAAIATRPAEAPPRAAIGARYMYSISGSGSELLLDAGSSPTGSRPSSRLSPDRCGDRDGTPSASTDIVRINNPA
jgi:serine/threonine-protein kinase